MIMKRSEIIKFTFETPLHIGTVRADYSISSSIIHSDTLYAAIMQAWSLLGKEEWIPKKDQWQDLGFSLSSLFPYTTAEEETVYFFPKPYGRLNDKNLKEDQKPENKQNKNVQYYDADYFLRFLNNEPVESNYAEHMKGAYLTSKSINQDFMDKQVYPRVRVAREAGEDALPYYIERVYFKEGSGMFAIVQYEREEERKRLHTALRLLEDEGMGTDRHVGNGLFKFTTADNFMLNESLPNSSDYALNLSLFCPDSKDKLEAMISDPASRYEIIQRGGWLTTYPYMSYRKKTVHMFREGSVFRFPLKEMMANGHTHDLVPNAENLPEGKAPEHPVWRCGKSLFVPVKVDNHA